MGNDKTNYQKRTAFSIASHDRRHSMVMVKCLLALYCKFKVLDIQYQVSSIKYGVSSMKYKNKVSSIMQKISNHKHKNLLSNIGLMDLFL